MNKYSQASTISFEHSLFSSLILDNSFTNLIYPLNVQAPAHCEWKFEFTG